MPKTPEISWIEKKPGVLIAANVKVDQFLPFREEGFNFFDQPPLSWLLAETQLIPADIFLENIDDETVLKYLILVAVRCPSCFPLSAHSIRAYDTGIFTQIPPIRAESKKILQNILKDPSVLEPENVSTLSTIARVLEQLYFQIKQYPLLIDYLREYWSNLSTAKFAIDGSTKEKAKAGKYDIMTYGAWKDDKEQAKKTDPRWVGLEELVPDDSAAQPREKSRQIGYSIVKIMTGGKSP